MPDQPPSSSISSSSAVDDAFERLFGYKFGTTFDLPVSKADAAGPVIPATTSKTSAAQQLLEIFGRSKAARILGSLGDGMKAATRKRGATSTADGDTVMTDANIGTGTFKKRRRNYKDIELPQTNLKKITETKVFAGQTIQTTTTVVASSSSSSAAATDGSEKGSGPTASTSSLKPPPTAAGAGPGTAIGGKKKASASSNLDSVLANLADPKKMNTVEKTSNDWEQLKEKDAVLKEELEKKAQSKDAFLVKQDFLNRVDQRKFEIEKDERDRERAQRNTTT